MSLKLECHTNWNVTQIGLSLKLDCYDSKITPFSGAFLKKKISMFANSVADFFPNFNLRNARNWSFLTKKAILTIIRQFFLIFKERCFEEGCVFF